jgi:intracellular multiplication protein IcmJ
MTTLLPIVLSAKKGHWQAFAGRQSQESFLRLASKVLERDDYSCRYCGFKSQQFQVVVNIDQNYQNNDLSNLATACSLCSPCFFIDALGKHTKGFGTIIYLPEISQADLNHFCRALFCSMLRDSPYKGKLQAVYLSLSERAQAVETLFGKDTQIPMLFGQTLIDSELSPAQMNHPLFFDLKLLPLRKFFQEEATYWKSTVFANIPL